MDNKEEKIVMFDSAEAAQIKTVTGWVSRHGNFFGKDERIARYDGCTHRACDDCGKPVEKGWLVCKDCREKRDKIAYDAMPKVVWDEKGGLYSQTHDKYFWSWDEVEEYCEDEDVKKQDLRLVICEPQYPRRIDTDYFCDEMAEDGELPHDILKAMDAFNEVLKNSGPLSWYPGKKAAIGIKENKG